MSLRSQVAIIVSLSLFLWPAHVLATTYGSGNYGSHTYGTVTSNTPVPNATPTVGCSQPNPGSAPWIYGAIIQSENSILLYFTDSADPVDHYVLEYGTKSGDYAWGNSDIGKKGSRTYLVQSLSPNTTYYFRVRGGNGCATGAWSNEVAAKTKVQSALPGVRSRPDTDISKLYPLAGPVPSPLESIQPVQYQPTIQPTLSPSPTVSVPTARKFPVRIALAVLIGASLLGGGAFIVLKRKQYD
ncbi:MAG: fibronectin type III domain-containing protein [Candidatus Woesebacteria bacterium]